MQHDKICFQARGKLRTLINCPPGLFLFDGEVSVRTEYGDDAYVLASGEYFWGGTSKREERNALIVQPLKRIRRS